MNVRTNHGWNIKIGTRIKRFKCKSILFHAFLRRFRYNSYLYSTHQGGKKNYCEISHITSHVIKTSNVFRTHGDVIDLNLIREPDVFIIIILFFFFHFGIQRKWYCYENMRRRRRRAALNDNAVQDTNK